MPLTTIENLQDNVRHVGWLMVISTILLDEVEVGISKNRREEDELLVKVIRFHVMSNTPSVARTRN